jgi:ubiquitin carboxyl-terminal hydrolase 48
MMHRHFCLCVHRKNCKDNPNCFQHLGGEQWLKKTTKTQSVADDVIKERCREGDSPVGLANLGATCYANSLLQALFYDASFREAIFKSTANSSEMESSEYMPVKMEPSQGTPTEMESSHDTFTQLELSQDKSKMIESSQGMHAKMEPSFDMPISKRMCLREKSPQCDNNNSSAIVSFVSDSIIDHVKYVFTQLQCSKHKWVVPTGFIDFLGLSYTDQQDVHEFRKLLLSVLEEVLDRQQQQVGREPGFISSHFTGEYTYNTTCLCCKSTTSVASSYQELELNIEGNETLSESLDAFFKAEALTGENQYYCSHCQCKQDATRQIQLRSVPPVLTLVLMRFVFNMSLMAKMKVNSTVVFPKTLDLSVYSRENGCTYELNSVIIHTGPTAYSGHYIAHIKHEEKWWRFDDQNVTPLSGRRRHVGQEEEVDIWGDSQPNKPKVPKDHFSSTNAYILVYTRSQGPLTSPPPPNPSPPSQMMERVSQENDVLLREIGSLASDEAVLHKQEEIRRQEMAELFATLPVKTGSKSFHWLSSEWISKLLARDSPGVVSNKKFLCKHNRLSPHMASEVKRVDSETATSLYRKHGLESAPLTSEAMCVECVQEEAALIRQRTQLENDLKLLTSLSKAPCSSSSGFWVGKESLQHWKKHFPSLPTSLEYHGGQAVSSEDSNLTETKNKMAADTFTVRESQEHSSSEGQEGQPLDNTVDPIKRTHHTVGVSTDHTDHIVGVSTDDRVDISMDVNQQQFAFNEDVKCIHGQLAPGDKQKKLVSASAWSLFEKYFPNSPKYGALDRECPACLITVTDALKEMSMMKERAAREKSSLSELYSSKNRPSLSECAEAVYIIPKAFLNKWIHFVRSGGIQSLPEMNMSSLLCGHDKLFLDLADNEKNLCKIVVMLREEEWQVLKSAYNPNMEVKIWKSCDLSCDLSPKHVVDKWLSSPEVCLECIEEDRKQKSSFEKGYINVLKTEVDPQSVQTNPSHSTQSTWSLRRRLPAGCAKVEVSSWQTLMDLKLQLMELHGDTPSDMDLFYNEEELVGEDKTLMDLGIVPNALVIMKVLSAEETKNNFIRETAATYSKSKEEGFSGTNLIVNK